jgi:hypothetical protein
MNKQPATPADLPEELARLRDDLIEFYRPVGSQERMAVERLALAQQSMLRAARLEDSLFANPPGKELHSVLESEAFKFFLRYHAQAQRTYSTALKELMLLRSQRPPVQPAPSDGPARPRLVPPPHTTIPPSHPCMPTALALRL